MPRPAQAQELNQAIAPGHAEPDDALSRFPRQSRAFDAGDSKRREDGGGGAPRRLHRHHRRRHHGRRRGAGKRPGPGAAVARRHGRAAGRPSRPACLSPAASAAQPARARDRHHARLRPRHAYDRLDRHGAPAGGDARAMVGHAGDDRPARRGDRPGRQGDARGRSLHPLPQADPRHRLSRFRDACWRARSAMRSARRWPMSIRSTSRCAASAATAPGRTPPAIRSCSPAGSSARCRPWSAARSTRSTARWSPSAASMPAPSTTSFPTRRACSSPCAASPPRSAGICSTASQRIARGEAIAAGVPEDRMPVVTVREAECTPATVNTEALTQSTASASRPFRRRAGAA